MLNLSNTIQTIKKEYEEMGVHIREESIRTQLEKNIQDTQKQLEKEGYIITEKIIAEHLEKQGHVARAELFKRFPWESIRLIENSPGVYTFKRSVILKREDPRKKPYKAFTIADWKELMYTRI